MGGRETRRGTRTRVAPFAREARDASRAPIDGETGRWREIPCGSERVKKAYEAAQTDAELGIEGKLGGQWRASGRHGARVLQGEGLRRGLGAIGHDRIENARVLGIVARAPEHLAVNGRCGGVWRSAVGTRRGEPSGAPGGASGGGSAARDCGATRSVGATLVGQPQGRGAKAQGRLKGSGKRVARVGGGWRRQPPAGGTLPPAVEPGGRRANRSNAACGRSDQRQQGSGGRGAPAGAG